MGRKTFSDTKQGKGQKLRIQRKREGAEGRNAVLLFMYVGRTREAFGPNPTFSICMNSGIKGRKSQTTGVTVPMNLSPAESSF